MNLIDLRAEISVWAKNTNSEFVALIPRIISFGQFALERQLRIPAMEQLQTQLTSPVNATFTSGAGTLAAGTYYYRVSALDAYGETVPSTETSITLGGTGGVNVNWTAVTGATGYKIYGRTSGAELLLATVGAVTTWLDGGSITPSGAMPTYNNTYSLLKGQNTFAIPSDYIESIYMSLIYATKQEQYEPMERVSNKHFLSVVTNLSTTNTGQPKLYARFNDKFYMDKYADKDYGLKTNYYRRLPQLVNDTDTNYWSTSCEQAFLFACLVEAIPYLEIDDKKAALWISKRDDEIFRIKQENSRENISGEFYTHFKGNLFF